MSEAFCGQVIELPIRDGNFLLEFALLFFYQVIELPIRDGNQLDQEW